MRLITYASGPAGAPRIGVRVGHRVLDIESASRVDGEPLPSSMKGLLHEGRGALSRVQALARKAQSDAGRFSGALLEERAIRFLPPVPDPHNFLCVGGDHRMQAARPQDGGPTAELPQEAGLAKLDSCLVGHDAKVAIPAGAKHFGCEPQLVFVIGKRALGVKGEEAMEHAVGVTILCGLADRGMRDREEASGSRVTASSNAAGCAALGPEIATMDEIGDPYDLWLTCAVNGEERMRVSMRDRIVKLPAVLERFSSSIPIEPGDLFCVGAPGGAAAGRRDANEPFLKPGDVVECSIEGITTLRATIGAASANPSS